MSESDPSPTSESVPNLVHWLAPADVAAKLGVSYLVVLSWVTGGVKLGRGRLRLPAKKLGGRWRIDPAQVGPFVDAMTRAALGEGPEIVPPPPAAAKYKRRVKESAARVRAMLYE